MEQTKPIFQTIEEYEEYLDRLYEMIEARLECNQNKIEEIDPMVAKECGHCGRDNHILDPKFSRIYGKVDAYTDCLTFFKWARLEDAHSKRIFERILEGSI